MDEDKKKKITIGIIAVCLVLAIAITLGTRGGGGGGGGVRKGKRWVKCVNPDCGAEYQMTNKEYAEEMANVDIDPMMMSSTKPALVCRECGEESIYTAIKCSNEECGAVFFRNTGKTDRWDYPDRCPVCGVSETEERLKRKQRGEE